MSTKPPTKTETTASAPTGLPSDVKVIIKNVLAFNELGAQLAELRAENERLTKELADFKDADERTGINVYRRQMGREQDKNDKLRAENQAKDAEIAALKTELADTKEIHFESVGRQHNWVVENTRKILDERDALTTQLEAAHADAERFRMMLRETSAQNNRHLDQLKIADADCAAMREALELRQCCDTGKARGVCRGGCPTGAALATNFGRALLEELARKTEALRTAKQVIEKGEFITDTLWVGPAETLIDRIDAALAPAKECGK